MLPSITPLNPSPTPPSRTTPLHYCTPLNHFPTLLPFITPQNQLPNTTPLYYSPILLPYTTPPHPSPTPCTALHNSSHHSPASLPSSLLFTTPLHHCLHSSSLHHYPTPLSNATSLTPFPCITPLCHSSNVQYTTHLQLSSTTLSSAPTPLPYITPLNYSHTSLPYITPLHFSSKLLPYITPLHFSPKLLPYITPLNYSHT